MVFFSGSSPWKIRVMFWNVLEKYFNFLSKLNFYCFIRVPILSCASWLDLGSKNWQALYWSSINFFRLWKGGKFLFVDLEKENNGWQKVWKWFCKQKCLWTLRFYFMVHHIRYFVNFPNKRETWNLNLKLETSVTLRHKLADDPRVKFRTECSWRSH